MKNFFKSNIFKLILICMLFLSALIIVLPATPLNIGPKTFQLGGYVFNFGKNTIDLSEFKRGLDIKGGVRIVLEADMSQILEKNKQDALDSSREIIERRINFLGVSESVVTPSVVGNVYRITVEIPGVSDVASAISLIGSTAQLRFRQLKPEATWDGTQYQEYYVNPEVWEDVNITGADLTGASVVFGQGQAGVSNAPTIQLNFTSEGIDKFSNVAKQNLNKPIGIYLDDSPFPLSMPTVSPELADGLVSDPVITGNFSIEDANSLSIQIRAGALPVPVKVVQQETIAATLGANIIQNSIVAGLIGMMLIMIYMVLVYGRLGLIADFALILYTLLVLSVFKIVPVVITLPGITGFLLSIGVAIDANILIFERIREEKIWGRPNSVAIKNGFDRAWPSIRDSNVSSLITAFILFYLGSGAVRGFALTLSIGILVSLFTAVFIVKNLIQIFGLHNDVKSSKFRFLHKIMFWRKYANN